METPSASIAGADATTGRHTTMLAWAKLWRYTGNGEAEQLYRPVIYRTDPSRTLQRSSTVYIAQAQMS